MHNTKLLYIAMVSLSYIPMIYYIDQRPIICSNILLYTTTVFYTVMNGNSVQYNDILYIEMVCS